jgi:hypothetical protein
LLNTQLYMYMIIISVIQNWNIVESGVKRNNHISDVQICNHNGKIIGKPNIFNITSSISHDYLCLNETLVRLLKYWNSKCKVKSIISKPAGKPSYDYLYQRDILVIL